MMVPPLSERPVTEEDEEQFRRESMPRKYTLRQRWADYRAEARANRPKGMKARVQAWLHVEPFYWGMRAAYVILFVGAVFAVYINGVAEGWWHAWGDKPTVAATTPAAQSSPLASSSTDAAMSGGYQIGPDGVLVRPAEHAASTYTKPELPNEAKEHTERGAEAAARHYIATLSYAWNTGDTQSLASLSAEGVPFAEGHIEAINQLYANGWAYGNKAKVTNIVTVEPVTEEQGARPNTIGVEFHVATTNGISCKEQKIVISDNEYTVSFSLWMTWQDQRWIVTDGYIPHEN